MRIFRDCLKLIINTCWRTLKSQSWSSIVSMTMTERFHLLKYGKFIKLLWFAKTILSSFIRKIPLLKMTCWFIFLYFRSRKISSNAEALSLLEKLRAYQKELISYSTLATLRFKLSQSLQDKENINCDSYFIVVQFDLVAKHAKYQIDCSSLI